VIFIRNHPINGQTAIEVDRAAIENSDRTSIILEYIKENGKGRNADFSKLLGLSPQRVREILKDLIQEELIEKHGERRYTYYTAKNKTKHGQDGQH